MQMLDIVNGIIGSLLDLNEQLLLYPGNSSELTHYRYVATLIDIMFRDKFEKNSKLLYIWITSYLDQLQLYSLHDIVAKHAAKQQKLSDTTWDYAKTRIINKS